MDWTHPLWHRDPMMQTPEAYFQSDYVITKLFRRDLSLLYYTDPVTLTDDPTAMISWDKFGTFDRIVNPANTKYLYNICTKSAQRRRRWISIVQM